MVASEIVTINYNNETRGSREKLRDEELRRTTGVDPTTYWQGYRWLIYMSGVQGPSLRLS